VLTSVINKATFGVRVDGKVIATRYMMLRIIPDGMTNPPSGEMFVLVPMLKS